MNRREFIQVSSAASLAAVLPKLACSSPGRISPVPLMGKRSATTSIWEAALIGLYDKKGFEKDLMARAMAKWVGGTKARWADVQFMSFGEFGEIWRNHYKSNPTLV